MCRKRKRDADEEGYLQQNLNQHQAWADKNRDRVNEIAKGVRNKAKESARFHCEVYNHNAATPGALEDHNKSRAHLGSDKNYQKPPTVRNSAEVGKWRLRVTVSGSSCVSDTEGVSGSGCLAVVSVVLVGLALRSMSPALML
ncbi:hypothetical protein BDZ85DRAFT_261534 [Elsinoe ampelina]|uniref:Uncharacterized protein n=1 Tax=Elsinoe ampelina TaxID=302913 RepID=A0A6A6GCH4_9PEZI|nr:hypothetical protein BDZ85DRAFT_261534 [Elsinoe ampelina]